MFFPTLATEAIGMKSAGTSGARSSRRHAPSSAMEETRRHRFGSLSNLVLMVEANMIPPSCPRPSLMTQFNAAAIGSAPWPRPTAWSRAWEKGRGLCVIVL